MNAPTVILSGRRGAEWQKVLGSATLPIKLESPQVLHLEGSPDEPSVMLDVAALSDEQREKLVDHLAAIFSHFSTREGVRQEILSRGVPIRLDGDTKVHLPEGFPKPARPSGLDMRFFQ